MGAKLKGIIVSGRERGLGKYRMEWWNGHKESGS